jgi:hypothetical protein
MNFFRAEHAFFSVAMLLVPLMSNATQVSTGSTTVKLIYSYPQYGGGDFVFKTNNSTSGCEDGFYMKQTDPGFKASVAAILSAQAAGKAIEVWGEDSDIWPGSGGKYCRLYTIAVYS